MREFILNSCKEYNHTITSHNSDFSDRDQAVKLLIEKFGEQNVIPVTNFAQLQLRSLIKDVARLNNLPFEEINEATGKIEAEVLENAKAEEGFDRGVWVLTYEEAEKHSSTFRELLSKYPEFQDTIKILFKQMRNCFSDKVSILTSNGYKTIHNISNDDSVAFVDVNGDICFNKNYEKISQGKKQIYSITLANGKKLELTADHEVMTKNGYKQVKNLTEDDEIYCLKE